MSLLCYLISATYIQRTAVICPLLCVVAGYSRHQYARVSYDYDILRIIYTAVEVYFVLFVDVMSAIVKNFVGSAPYVCRRVLHMSWHVIQYSSDQRKQHAIQ